MLRYSVLAEHSDQKSAHVRTISPKRPVANLVPRAHDHSDLRQGSRALDGPDFLSIRREFVSYSQPIRFARFDGKSVNRGLPVLDKARALDPWGRSKGSWLLGREWAGSQNGGNMSWSEVVWIKLSHRSEKTSTQTSVPVHIYFIETNSSQLEKLCNAQPRSQRPLSTSRK